MTTNECKGPDCPLCAEIVKSFEAPPLLTSDLLPPAVNTAIESLKKEVEALAQAHIIAKQQKPPSYHSSGIAADVVVGNNDLFKKYINGEWSPNPGKWNVVNPKKKPYLTHDAAVRLGCEISMSIDSAFMTRKLRVKFPPMGPYNDVYAFQVAVSEHTMEVLGLNVPEGSVWSDDVRKRWFDLINKEVKEWPEEVAAAILADEFKYLHDAEYAHHHDIKKQAVNGGYVPLFDAVDGSTIQRDLSRVVPAIHTVVPCPAKTGLLDLRPCPAPEQDIMRQVVHLNDTHRWSRDQIADWMESLDLDLSFKSGEEVNT